MNTVQYHDTLIQLFIFLVKIISVINAQRWNMIDVLMDLIGCLVTVSEICLGSIFYVLLFQVQVVEVQEGSVYPWVFAYSIL